MKLIIDISESDYEWVCEQNMGFELYQMIANGTPLEKHDEEVIKETVESIWGKPPYTEVLDSIRAEIEEQIERDFAFAKTEEVKVPVHYGTANGLQVAVRIIDKYRKEQTDADSD